MRPGQCLEIEASLEERRKFELLAERRGAFILRDLPLVAPPDAALSADVPRGETLSLLTLCKRLP